MDGILQRVVSIIVAVAIFFILPVYIAYEKRDDISYAMALKITTDFVEEVKSTGYISSDMYYDFVSNLAVTGNSYDIYMEHTAKKYNPVIYSYTDDLTTIRAKFDYNLYKDDYETGQIVVTEGNNAGTYTNLILAYDLAEERYTEEQILTVISSTDKTVTVNTSLDTYKSIDYYSLPAISSIYVISTSDNTNIYTMNEGDEFNVIIKNKNTTAASTIFSAITLGSSSFSNTKIYVNYGGTIKAETYRDKAVDDDTTNYNPETDTSSTSSLVNSYITDGLVLLLNGEYNSGTSHSNSTDNWVDLSGNGNNAALSGFSYDDESGWIYNGLLFTGSEYVSIGDLDLSEMTIEVVVKFNTVNDSDSSEQSVLSNINSGGAGLVYNLLNSSDSSKKGKISFDVYVEDDSGNIELSSLVGDDVIQANKIYSISGSFGKIGLSLDDTGIAYETMVQLLSINGNAEGIDISGTLASPASGTGLAIGGLPLAGSGATTQLKGTVYCVRIYNRALTEEEIEENYEIDKAKYGIE